MTHSMTGRLLALSLLLAPSSALAQKDQAGVDLSGTKAYMLTRLSALKASTAKLVTASDSYYQMAKAVNFDYAKLWKSNPTGTKAAVEAARAAWRDASPRYEQIEGFFAGQEPFTDLDFITDAANPGPVAAGGSDNNVKLPSGKVLVRPGALFNLTESALWGLNPVYVSLKADLGAKDGLGNALPDADVVLGGAQALDAAIGKFQALAKPWQPNSTYVFNTLTANLPTTQDFLEIWRNSRFVSGSGSKVQEFAAISRLNDLRDNISSWQAIYAGVSPAVVGKNAALNTQIQSGMQGLHKYVETLIAREKTRHFTPEQAKSVQDEAQNRATAVTGSVTQAAALLGIKVSGK
ncbi:imelysin family protein [Deinococcus sp. UYEF24]